MAVKHTGRLVFAEIFMVSFENVSKFILSDISFCIPEGTATGVIGPGGSGKTTLLRLACGLLACERGNVRTFSWDPVKKRRKIASAIGFFSSSYPLFREDSTIRSEFRRLCALYRLDKKGFREEYERLAVSLGFKEYEEKEIRQLSLGQLRRAELATVLLDHLRLILLDEPTVGVDESGKEIFDRHLQKKKEQGAAILIASENMTEIERVCDRLLLLDVGRLLYYGSRKRLMRRYAPVNEMEIAFCGMLPDMEDLPLSRYGIEHNRMKFRYDENVISALEIINHVAAQTEVTQMNIVRPGLEDVILMHRREAKT